MTITHEMRYGAFKDGLDTLCKTVKSILGDNLNIVEIGCYCGSSTLIISDVFPNSKMSCVDGWTSYIEDGATYTLEAQAAELKEAEIIFDERISSRPNISKKRMLSLDYVKEVEDESIDFVYIDGNHSYSFVKDDINHWLPKIKTGGVISGHDWCWQTVQRSVLETMGKEPFQTFIDSSWMYIKN